MKARMRTAISGRRGSFTVDDEIDWPDAEVERLVAKGYAEKVEPAKKQRKKQGETHAEDLGGEQR